MMGDAGVSQADVDSSRGAAGDGRGVLEKRVGGARQKGGSMDGGLIVGVVSLVATVVGIVIGVRIRPRRQRLVYQMAVMRYFDKADYALPDCAEMSYEGMAVERLSKATIYLWNKGTDELRGEDIVASDPLRLSIGEGGRYLDVEVDRTSDESNGCTTAMRPKRGHEVELGYDYLNAGEGMRVTVLHDAANAEPEVLGRAKGLAGGPESWGVVESGTAVTRTRKINRRRLVVQWVVSVALLFGVALAVFSVLSAVAPVLPDVLAGPGTIVAATFVISASVMFRFVPGAVSGGVRRRFPKALE